MTLAERLSGEAPAGVSLRSETELDEPFLDRLYASTRTDEMAQVPWPPDAVASFLRQQSALQRAHYRQHYANALLLIIERSGHPIGRLYLYETGDEVRVMDIALLPAERGQGLGTTLLTAVMDHARGNGQRVTLHVEPSNAAQRLYTRAGFRLVERRGVYDFLEWIPPRRPDQLSAERGKP